MSDYKQIIEDLRRDAQEQEDLLHICRSTINAKEAADAFEKLLAERDYLVKKKYSYTRKQMEQKLGASRKQSRALVRELEGARRELNAMRVDLVNAINSRYEAERSCIELRARLRFMSVEHNELIAELKKAITDRGKGE